MRDLITAYHEAGHGLARYAANKAIEQIRVLTDEQQQAYSRELGKAVTLGGAEGGLSLYSASVIQIRWHRQLAGPRARQLHDE